MSTSVAHLFIFRSALRKGSIQQVGCDWWPGGEQHVTEINTASTKTDPGVSAAGRQVQPSETHFKINTNFMGAQRLH